MKCLPLLFLLLLVGCDTKYESETNPILSDMVGEIVTIGFRDYEEPLMNRISVWNGVPGSDGRKDEYVPFSGKLVEVGESAILVGQPAEKKNIDSKEVWVAKQTWIPIDTILYIEFRAETSS